MMKKNYKKPTANVLAIRLPQAILAASETIGQGGGTGEGNHGGVSNSLDVEFSSGE